MSKKQNSVRPKIGNMEKHEKCLKNLGKLWVKQEAYGEISRDM